MINAHRPTWFSSRPPTFAATSGRLWKARYGVPYVLDMQDPWVYDHHSEPGRFRPARGTCGTCISVLNHGRCAESMALSP